LDTRRNGTSEVEGGTEVSIVIPTRGRWSLLKETLAAALAQEGVSHEVVVVDDGSRDETAAELGEVGDERLRVLRHEHPRGVAVARNRGIAEARGEWVAFLDDDDLWSAHKLRNQLKVSAETSADFAYSAVVAVDEQITVTRGLPFPPPDELLRLELRQNAVPAGGSNVIVRADLLRRLDGFDERLYHLADWDLWIRLADTAHAAASPEVDVAYVEHGLNMHMSELGRIRREFTYLVEKHGELSRRHGIDFDRLGFDLWIAWAHRRSGHARKAAWLYLRGGVLHRSPKNLARAAWMIVPGPRKEPGGPPAPPTPEWLAGLRRGAATEPPGESRRPLP
jgi:glycosyltransferase involved in cell wall biosynthesis